MFIQAENQAENLFARERVIFNCQVQEINQEASCYDPLLDQMHCKFGETVGVLRSLSDFHLLQLRPVSGQYIYGFGKAFSIKVENGLLSQVTINRS